MVFFSFIKNLLIIIKYVFPFCLHLADLKEFTQICKFFGSSQSELIKPYINSLITSWISKEWPILKYAFFLNLLFACAYQFFSRFPYFLCYSHRDDFIKENIAIIVACTLLHIPTADLKKLNKYATDEELIKVL